MSLIESSVHHNIHELRLQRAPVNALNPDLCNALTHAIHHACAQNAQGIVLAGGPKVFSAGLDVPLAAAAGSHR